MKTIQKGKTMNLLLAPIIELMIVLLGTKVIANHLPESFSPIQKRRVALWLTYGLFCIVIFTAIMMIT